MGAHRLADVDDLRACLLRSRDDAAVDAALRRRALRLRAARQPAPVGRDDRRRHADQQDGAGAAQGLRPDAGAALRHLDGLVRQRRRLLPLFLFGGARLRPHRAGRHLRARLPADGGGAALRRAAAAEEDPPRPARSNAEPLRTEAEREPRQWTSVEIDRREGAAALPGAVSIRLRVRRTDADCRRRRASSRRAQVPARRSRPASSSRSSTSAASTIRSARSASTSSITCCRRS